MSQITTTFRMAGTLNALSGSRGFEGIQVHSLEWNWKEGLKIIQQSYSRRKPNKKRYEKS